MKNKKIYLAGSGGMLGQAFYEIFRQDNELKLTDIDINADWLSYLDFRSREEYFKDVVDFKPDYLFHLGAHTNLEYCEVNVDDSYITNSLSVEYAVEIANYLKIPLLYISTAGIFDGSKDTFDDWDTPNPLGVYARSKYIAEIYVAQNANRYLTCRAGWMMGGGPLKDKKFINKIISQINSGQKHLKIVNDRDGTPTYTIDFAKNVMHIMDSDIWGLFNLVCSGQTSRMEVAEEIIKILGVQDSVSIEIVSSEHFKSEYFAARPTSERLINRRLDLLGLNKMRDWKVALNEYLQNSYI